MNPNRGHIPGFYWDEGKKKYFRIQATHNVPVNAKYSKSNVVREQSQKRQVKRRKTVEKALAKNRVHRANVFQASHLLSSCGLHRELGYRQYRPDYDAAFVEGLRHVPHSIYLDPEVINFDYFIDHQILPESQIGVTATAHTTGSKLISTGDLSGPAHVNLAFPEEMVSMEAVETAFGPVLLACGNHASTAYYHFGPIERELPDFTDGVLRRRKPLPTLQQIFTSRLNTVTHAAAFSGTGGIRIRNLESHGHDILTRKLDDESDSFALGWLSPSTLAFGLSQKGEGRPSHSVFLWDVRIRDGEGTAKRISRRHRITGIESADNSATNLMVTSNHHLDLYDLRMTRTDASPLVSIPHRSPGPQLNYSMKSQSQLVAAADEYNVVQVYSLGTGRLVRSLTSSNDNQTNTKIGKLRWQEDPDGIPGLTACHRHSIQSWSW